MVNIIVHILAMEVYCACIRLMCFIPQIIAYVREEMKKTGISEQTMIGIVWTSVMSAVEWNKKEELVTEQAIKHLKVSTPFMETHYFLILNITSSNIFC